MRRRNVLKSHPLTLNDVINYMKLLFLGFANFHLKPRLKMSEKYAILQLWPQKNIFPPRSTATPPILADAQFYKESFEVWIVVVHRCTKKILSKNGEKVDFIHEYSRIFENINIFLVILTVLSSCRVKVMIYPHHKKLTKFTEFSLSMAHYGLVYMPYFDP